MAIREGTKPTQEMLDKYAGIFLLGKPLGFDMDTLLDEIDRADGGSGNPSQADSRS
jgi:hypothetical protein